MKTLGEVAIAAGVVLLVLFALSKTEWGARMFFRVKGSINSSRVQSVASYGSDNYYPGDGVVV